MPRDHDSAVPDTNLAGQVVLRNERCCTKNRWYTRAKLRDAIKCARCAPQSTQENGTWYRCACQWMDRSTRRRVPRSDCRFPRSPPKVSVENRPALPTPCTRRDHSRTQRRLLLPHANPREPPLGPEAVYRTLVSDVV